MSMSFISLKNYDSSCSDYDMSYESVDKKEKEPLIGPSSTGVSGAFFKIRHISLRSSRTEPIFFLIAFLETAHER